MAATAEMAAQQNFRWHPLLGDSNAHIASAITELKKNYARCEGI